MLIASITVILTLWTGFFFIKYRNEQYQVVSIEHFDSSQNRNSGGRVINRKYPAQKLTPEQFDLIVKQKIAHKKMSIIAYVSSLIVSFLLGGWAIVKIINGQLDWKLLYDALSISGGIASTISFKRLHKKCSDEVNSLLG